MSYNPARAAGNHRNKRVKRYDPHAGTKHSDIMRRKGVGFDATSAERSDTRHGFTSPVFSCDSFVQRYVCLYAGNNTGIGVTEKGDRSIRVMVGTLYVTFLNKEKITDDEGNETVKDVASIQQFGEGYNVSLPKGTKYSLASSGTANVEILLTETVNYQDSWKELGEAAITASKNVMVVPPRTATRRRPRGESKAYQQAQQVSGRKGEITALAETRRRSSGDNVNSSAVVGVNPRPSGPPIDD